jgi:O-antigen/teichoic acid export membrane protein
VSDVALARLLQAVLGVIGLWLTLTVGLKLMALVVMHALNLIVAGAWLLRRRGPLLLSIFRERGERGAINWRREIWPFQWRIAASWIGGYCGTQAITLVLFEHLGPVEAGRFGLSLTVLGALASGATAWLTTKAPRFGGFVAQRRYDELVNQYRDAARAAMVVGVLGVVVLLTLVAAFGHLRESLAERFVPLLGLAAMAAATLASIRIGGQAIFLRSFRREPFLTLSIAIGVLQTVVAAVLAREGGVVLVAFGYSAVVVLIGLSWAQIVFMRSRQDYLAR